MGSTLMAATSILLCSGLAAVISSTYSVKKPLNDTVYGAHGEFIHGGSQVCHLPQHFSLLLLLLLSVHKLHKPGQHSHQHASIPTSMVTPQYIHGLLEKGFILKTLGNRLFYVAIPLLLWIFGPVLVFLCSCTIIPVLYNLELPFSCAKKANKDINENPLICMKFH